MTKYKEILNNNYGLAEKIFKETGIANATLTKYKNGARPGFKNKVKIYECLLDLKMINPDMTSIEELFE